MLTEIETKPVSNLTWLSASRETEEVIRQHSKTFHFATGLLPSHSKSAVRALYGFCRRTDDLVDRDDATLAELEAWRAQVDLPVEEQTDPVLFYWSSIRQKYQVNRQYEQELIDGVSMDLEHRIYQTWQELERYCYHVASTVGLMSLPIIGTAEGVSHDDAAPYAIKLGVALQMTNILRDVGEDLVRNRIYLPQEDLARFGLTHADIQARVSDHRFINLMRFEIERTRRLFEESLPGIALLNPLVRPAVAAAALLYRAILDEIEAIRYHVYTRRAFVSGWKKLALLPGIFWQIRTLKPPPAAPKNTNP
jgi:15-cis-phytoene synthase